MMSATYFGEITELGSRAVWYSDEEDDDEDDGTQLPTGEKKRQIPIISDEMVRSSFELRFQRVGEKMDTKFDSCIVSLASSAQFKNFKLSDPTSSYSLGYLDTVGKVFAFKTDSHNGDQEQYDCPYKFLLWILIDSSHEYVSGYQVGYLVQNLLSKIRVHLDISSSAQIIILSKQFSESEHLEYLSLYHPCDKIVGHRMQPPTLIKSTFESSLFEQLTIVFKPVVIVCLPDPRNFWFDKNKSWPSAPNQIIELRLNDNTLEKTLIFT